MAPILVVRQGLRGQAILQERYFCTEIQYVGSVDRMLSRPVGTSTLPVAILRVPVPVRVQRTLAYNYSYCIAMLYLYRYSTCNVSVALLYKYGAVDLQYR